MPALAAQAEFNLMNDTMTEEATTTTEQCDQLQSEFKRLVLDGKLDPKVTDTLTELVTAGFCTHRTWGFGKITTVDTLMAKVTIDFQSNRDTRWILGLPRRCLVR